ncbi:uncharacterized protein LOC135936817 [Cloeon dipterum]|uniref:uncharacterized protein LOC135936817 n=1 Tax=Cloeon dipterum TaxID=197152 RepID=UPI00322097BD
MNSFLCTFSLLWLSSLATAANFISVFEWPNQWDYEWPSEESRNRFLLTGAYKPEHFQARYMAVYGTRIFISLDQFYAGIPISLVALPTYSASIAPPKLTPFPSRNMHGKGDCDKIEEATGLEVDSADRLWVLDNGSEDCYAKLWIIHLSKNDQTEIIHVFPFKKSTHDLVLDETPNDTLAYIAWWGGKNIVVFSLKRKKSWIMDIKEIDVISIALSPKEEPRQLYLGKWKSTELYSISVAALRNNQTRAANPTLIGNWTAINPYRMLMDNHGTIYAAFFETNYTSFFHTSRPFKEQRLYQANIRYTGLPFTLALDPSGILWMVVYDDKGEPKYRILKAAVGAESYIFKPSPPVTPAIATTPITTTTKSARVKSTKRFKSTPTTEKSLKVIVGETATAAVQDQECECSIMSEKLDQYWLFIIILIASIVVYVILSSLTFLWFILRQKRNNPPKANEEQQLSVFRNNQQEVQDENSRGAACTNSVSADYDDVGPVEELYEEVIYHRPACTPPPPDLYEQPITVSERRDRQRK